MRLSDKKIMLPPWLEDPKAQPSIAKDNEPYQKAFDVWFRALSEAEQSEYQTLFPEPIPWSGWWEQADHTDRFVRGSFSTLFWRPNGVPRYHREDVQKGNEFCMFWGHHPSKDGRITKSCLSQWWMSSFTVMGQEYCCMEQYMMAQKALLFHDREIYEEILKNTNQKQIKALGRKVRNFDEGLWNEVKYSIVLNGNYCKFMQNKKLLAFLLSTKDKVLVEASPYDCIWGIGLTAQSPDAEYPLAWCGQNLLGFALMEVRDELRRVLQNKSRCD